MRASFSRLACDLMVPFGHANENDTNSILDDSVLDGCLTSSCP